MIGIGVHKRLGFERICLTGKQVELTQYSLASKMPWATTFEIYMWMSNWLLVVAQCGLEEGHQGCRPVIAQHDLT